VIRANTNAWLGMQGTGQIVCGAKDPTAYSVTLSMTGSDQFRLDAQSNKGEMSLRIHGSVGKIQGSSGDNSSRRGCSPDLPIWALCERCILPGERLLSSIMDSPQSVAFNFTELLSKLLPSAAILLRSRDKRSQSTSTSIQPRIFLPKSASSGFIAVGHSAKCLRVVTYSDYRKVGTSMVPFRYDESMDGQQYWVLQLSDVRLNPVFDATYFQF
jgi:hypothetical protein